MAGHIHQSWRRTIGGVDVLLVGDWPAAASHWIEGFSDGRLERVARDFSSSAAPCRSCALPRRGVSLTGTLHRWNPRMQFAAIPDVLAAMKRGEMVILVDDEDRENEGDLVMAAQFADQKAIAFMATKACGLICLAMEGPTPRPPGSALDEP